ncbi:TAP-like protein-domain-containing protein [Astrocystis sublimbata]|nr:TAP-like protein-domain-containing protein [Astrocystis sublimbata]
MVNTRSLPLLGLLPFAQASCARNCTWDTIVPSQALTWCSCYDGFYCAKLDVPLDYQDSSLGRASIPLIKLPAKANSSYGAYQGMVLMNPGGPGSSSIDEVQTNGVQFYQALTGDNWDIVGFEPRGIYRSEPNINCSATTATAHRTRSVPNVSDTFFTDFIESGEALAEQCAVTVGGERDAGPHMSSTTNARDMRTIVDAFAKTADGRKAAKPSDLLNYFGYSYGTFLGQIFASMFPDRVGNMVLDGVLGYELPLGENLTSIFTPADGIIASFFVYCFEAGPSQCPYSAGASDAHSVFDRFNQSFVQLDAQEAKAREWANATDIETALVTLKTLLYGSVAAPTDAFGGLGDALVALEQSLAINNVAAWTEAITALIGDPIAGAGAPELQLGTLCADQGNKWYNASFEDLTPILEHLREVSIVGEVLLNQQLGCLSWSIEASEVFSGPFGGDTKTPILFVGNTYDPISPVSNALGAAPRYKNAEVVTVDATGHTSRVVGNACQKAKVVAYFQKTQLPGKDAYCALEAGPFGITLDTTLDHAILEADLSSLQ